MTHETFLDEHPAQSATLPYRVVFVGCARNAARTLDAVLGNIEQMAARCRASHVILAENDSTDGTPALLQAWAAGRSEVTLLSLGQLDASMPLRTARLSHVRNACLDAIRSESLFDFDACVVLDFDDENTRAMPATAFDEALAFLFGADDIAGVFATAAPIYYDIYALRHPVWSPSDCWKEIRALPPAEQGAAYARLVRDRQVPIAPDHAPIEVDSAFGGLGIYKMPFATRAAYHGLDEAGGETCEHVAYNAVIRALGGRLFILPSFRNATPWMHVLGNVATKTIALNGPAGTIELLAPAHHQFDQYFSKFPLYDRRLAQLVAVLGSTTPAPSLIDVGANILDTLALVRTLGTTVRAVCIDAALEFIHYAAYNCRVNVAVFGPVDLRWAFLGRAEDARNIMGRAGTASVVGASPLVYETLAEETLDILSPPALSFETVAPLGVDLVKTDLDGYDHVALLQNLAWLKRTKPILWCEAQIAKSDDVAEWSRLLDEMAGDFPYVLAFDNFGFCLTGGALLEKWTTILDLIRLGHRYEKMQPTHGPARFHYVDLAFFPKAHKATYDSFVALLPEMGA